MNFREIVYVILNLAGALAVFMFAMKLMSEGLQKFAGSKLRQVLRKITGNPVSGILAGAGITAAIQSSTATTVMVVGFAGAGLLTLGGAVAVVMGANIGTTITAWIIALFGINSGASGDAITFSLPMLLGTLSLFFIFSKKSKMQYLGQTIMGLCLLLVGMELLENAIPELSDEVVHTIAMWSHWGFWSVLLFIAVGAILTIILQTSAAMTAVILLMASQGWIEFPMALALVMGQNLGTTLTAQVVAMTTGTTGKRAARAHLVFNIAGVLLCLILFAPITNGIMTVTGITDDLTDPLNQQRYPLAITIFHTLFNVGTTIVLAFFIPQIVKIVEWMVPEKAEEGEEEFKLTYLEPNLLSTAELNLQSARSEIEVFSKRVLKMYTFLPSLRTAKSEEEFDSIMSRIEKYEGITDRMDQEITKFLTRVGSGDVSQHASERISSMLRIIDNLESIGDAIFQIAMTRKSKREDAVHFDASLNANLAHMSDLVQKALDIMDSNIKDYDNIDLNAAYDAEHDINTYRDQLRAQHLDALKLGVYDYAIGNAYSGLYALYEKLGDYVINVSEAIGGKLEG